MEGSRGGDGRGSKEGSIEVEGADGITRTDAVGTGGEDTMETVVNVAVVGTEKEPNNDACRMDCCQELSTEGGEVWLMRMPGVCLGLFALGGVGGEEVGEALVC